MRTEKTLVLVGEELKTFVKDFDYEEEDSEDGRYRLKSSIEEISIAPLRGYITDDNQVINLSKKGYVIQSNFMDSAERVNLISRHYSPVGASKILKSFFDVLKVNELSDRINQIVIKDNGNLVFDMVRQNESDKSFENTKVLDFARYSNVDGIYDELVNNQDKSLIVDTTFGNYRPTFLLNNSYDLSRPVTMKLGIFRLVCSNGLIRLPANSSEEDILHLDRVRHYKTKNIMEQIRENLKKVPVLYRQFESDFFASKVDKGVYKRYLADYSKKYFNLEESKVSSVYVKERKRNTIEKGTELLGIIIDVSRNYLDFENLTSYLSKPEIVEGWQSGRRENRDNDIKGLYETVNGFIPGFREYVSKKLTRVAE